MNKEALSKSLKAHNFNIYIADMKGDNFSMVNYSTPLALVLSNESHGVSIWPEDVKKITIPIKNVESLNVASAGSILMHYLLNS